MPQNFFLKPNPDSVIVVDLSSGLKLINVWLKAEHKITAIKIIDLPSQNRDEAILNGIRDFISANNIQHKNAILSPYLSSLFIRRINIPALSDKELPQAIKWKVKDELPFDLSKASFAYRIIKKIAKEDQSKVLDVICVLALEDEIRKQVLLLKDAGLSCVSVGLLPFGYTKIVERYSKEHANEPNIGIVQLYENNSYLVFYKEGKLSFARELPVSVKKLKDALRVELVAEGKGKVKLSDDEIAEFIHSHGIPEGDFVFKDKISSGSVLAMLRPVLEMLAQEIKRSVSYYNTQFQGGIISRVLLAGEAVMIPNLDKFMAKELLLNVNNLFLPDKASTVKPADAKALAIVAGSFGLALDNSGDINLLPAEFRSEKFEQMEKFSLRWVAFAAFLILLVSYIFARVSVAAHKHRLEGASTQLGVLSQVKESRARLEVLDNFISSIRKKDAPVGDILKLISAIAPKELYFREFDLNCSSRKGRIEGFIQVKDSQPGQVLTRFVESFNDSQLITNAKIESIAKTGDETSNISNFKVFFELQ